MFLVETKTYEFKKKHEKYSIEETDLKYKISLMLDILILYCQSILIIKIGHFSDLAR